MKSYSVKIISVFVALLIISSSQAISFSAFADNNNDKIAYSETIDAQNIDAYKRFDNKAKAMTLESVTVAQDGEATVDGYNQGAFDEILTALKNRQATNNLKSYAISKDNIVNFLAAFQDAYPVEWDCAIVSSYNYNYYTASGYIATITFGFSETLTNAQYLQRITDLSAAVSKITDKIKDKNQFEKVLYTHDYIVKNTAYSADKETCYSAYGSLVKNEAVCAGYARAMRMILYLSGMQVEYITGDIIYSDNTTGSHAWNIVNVNNEWYQVDSTWDDPTPDREGYVSYEYFMLTDAQIGACVGTSTAHHGNWLNADVAFGGSTGAAEECTSTAYSAMPRASNYTQSYYNGKWYYIDSELSVYDVESAQVSAYSSFVPTSVNVYNGELYFSTDKIIKHFPCDELSASSSVSDGETVYTLSYSEGGDRYYYAAVSAIYISDDGILTYSNKKATSLGSGSYSLSVVSGENSVNLNNLAAVKGISADNNIIRISVGETKKLSVDIDSDSSTESVGISYATASYSANSSYVSIDSEGNITALAKGIETVNAYVGKYVQQFKVIVCSSDVYSGSCGTNVTWSLNNLTGVLTISGSGSMANYSGYPYVPWNSYRGYIESVEVLDGVTSLSPYAFYKCENLTYVSLPSTLTSVGASAFAYCTSLKKLFADENIKTFSGTDVFKSSSLLTVYCFENSTAQSYLSSNGYNYVLLSKQPFGNSQVSVDAGTAVISGISPMISDMSSYLSVDDGYSLEYEKAGNYIGTGTIINVMYGDITVGKYTVLIYGDIDGDGLYDGADALTASLIYQGLLDETNTSAVCLTAADVNRDGNVDANDVEILTQAGVLLSEIQQTETESLAAASLYSEYVGMANNYAQSSEISDSQVQDDYQSGSSDIVDIIKAYILTVIQMLKNLFA